MPVDDVKVRIGGDNKKLESQLNKSDRLISKFSKSGSSRLKSFGSALAKSLGSVFSLQGAIGLVAGGGGIGLLVKSSIDAADHIGKMASQVNIGVEAFQEFRHAASLAGVGSQLFEQSLRAMVRRQGEAINGNKAFAAGFEQVGISVKELQSLGTEELFERVADGLAGIADQSLKVAAADKIFSEAGRKLINVFGGGAAGIRKMRQEARDLGIVLDAVMVREAERAGDSLERVGRILKVNITRALLSLTPQIIAFGEAFAKYVVPFVKKFAKELPDTIQPAENLRESIAGLEAELMELAGIPLRDILKLPDLSSFGSDANEVKDLLIQLRVLDDLLEKRVTKEKLVAAAVAGSSSANATLAGKIRGVTDALQFELGQLGRTEHGQKLYKLAKDAGVEANFAFTQSVSPLLLAIQAEKERIEGATKATEAHKSALEGLKTSAQSIFESTRTPLERYQTQIENLNRLRELGAKRGGISENTYTRAVIRSQDALKKATTETQGLSSASKELGMTFASAFEDAVVKGKGLKDVLKGLGQDILRISTRKLVTEPLANSLTGLFGNISGGAGGGGGGGGGSAGGFASMFGSFASAFFHKGGIAGSSSAPTKMVSPMAFAGARRMHSGGLAGNEVPAILQRGEEVLTADDPRHRGNAGGKGGGGGPVTVTNNFNFPPGTDVETFRKSRTAIAAEMARAGEFAFGRNG